MSNAVEFISAYNTVDARLRSLYKGKGNLQFSDLVRRCAECNATVKKYEGELLTFAKLRNAIVHESTRDYIIAEPCDEATRLFTHIAELLSTPPKLSLLRERGATGISADATLGDAIVKIADSNFSNLPVYRGERMLGVLNNRRVVRVLGKALERGEEIERVLATPCASVLREEDLIRFYKVLGQDSPVQAAVDAFAQNRKLLAVLVTRSGEVGDRIVNILTSSDLPRLMKLLEE